MSEQTTAIRAPKPATRIAKSRARTVASLDGRTAASKRVREIEAALEWEITIGGGLAIEPGQRQLIRRAAFLGALAENLEARAVKGKLADSSEYVAVVSEQRRALAALGCAAQAGP